ncbi:SDR family oxidoreductase [Polynucleobacter sp. AP-Kaivos-20-H2]|uniref:UDP-glucose 4-epimerase family protein n=1 Tax=Polynucleobacter sp. AP-Kaivos-20-H2 TaxID=2689104 RepID=UPI001C0CEB51|nr:SDR family oxidoreductase [Polynucleobacter sp. AP-Kaivos-20-H2]MBU3604092.1 SDR family oxidoreductase [Polynucleobacter sp. AP-Kaivos-20-H2]
MSLILIDLLVFKGGRGSVSFLDEFNQLHGQRILVTGASGFVGSRLLASQDALAQNIQFRAITRGPLENPLSNVEQFLVSDISEKSDWTKALLGVDTIVHLAARVHVMEDRASNPLEKYRKANVISTLNLARQAANAGVKRFIFLSSIKVNGEKTNLGEPFTEHSIPKPEDPYGVSKLEAEEGVREICNATGMEYVLIRPPLIYGPGVKANYQKLMRLVQKRLPLPLGGIVNQRSMLALDNLIDFILLVARHPKAANQLFLLSDSQAYSTPHLIERMSKCMGYTSSRLISIPAQILRIAGLCLGQKAAVDRLTESLEVSTRKAHQLLNWNPPLNVEQAIQITVNDFLSSQEAA